MKDTRESIRYDMAQQIKYYRSQGLSNDDIRHSCSYVAYNECLGIESTGIDKVIEAYKND